MQIQSFNCAHGVSGIDDSKSGQLKETQSIIALAATLTGTGQSDTGDSGQLIGHYTLRENPALTAAICERLASEPGAPLPGYEEFRRKRVSHQAPPTHTDASRLVQLNLPHLSDDLARRSTIERLHRVMVARWKAKACSSWAQLPPTIEGYIEACCRLSEPLRGAVSVPLPYRLPLEARKRHALILGQTGSGKSELLKLQINETVRSGEGSVVVLDPHGDFAQQVARMSCFDGRKQNLVYVDPGLDPDRGRLPRYNPFSMPETATDEDVNYRMEALIGAFAQIIGNGEATFSNHMETVLKPLLSVLLKSPGSRLSDLIRWMHSEHWPRLIEAALPLLTNEHHRQFLAQSFPRDSYNPTRSSIETRLNSLLGSTSFAQILDAPRSSFDLPSLIANGQHLVCALSKGIVGESTSRALGCFLVAELQSWALRQQRLAPSDRKRVFLVIDEAHNYVSPALSSLLSEARKYGLHLVAATQYLGQAGMDQKNTNLRENSHVRIAGAMAVEKLKATSSMLNVEESTVGNLGTGQFLCRIGNHQTVKVQVRSDLVDQTGAAYLSPQAFERRKADQLSRYYLPDQSISTSMPAIRKPAPKTSPFQKLGPRPSEKPPARPTQPLVAAPAKPPAKRRPRNPNTPLPAFADDLSLLTMEPKY